MERKVIRAYFEDGENTRTAYGLTQYDYNMILEIHGLELPSVVEIQYSAAGCGHDTITRMGTTKDGVTTAEIPNALTEQPNEITAYVVCTSEGESVWTDKIIKLPVTTRKKPAGEPDRDTVLLEAFKQIAEGKADGLEYKDNILRLLSGEKELAQVTITGGSGSSIDAREIELHKGETAIQWRYAGQTEWTDLVLLEDLKGSPGKDGSNGVPGTPGKDGAPGQDGKDGASAYDLAVKNGYPGTETEWLASLKGDPGKDGASGADGAPGRDGTDGAPGKDGKGITSATINASGHLTIHYSDGTDKDVGKVAGEDGLDGASGIPVRVEMTAEDTVVELQPNKLYIFPAMASLTYTLAAPADASTAAEYHFMFRSPATATEVIHPTEANANGFTVEANRVYEVSIMEGLLAAQSWEVAA